MARQRPRARIATIALLLALVGTSAAPAGAGGAAATTYTIAEIGTLGGARSQAWGLNAAGQVVGWAETAAGQQRAYLWADGRLTDLGTLPGGEASMAVAVNARGQVVGGSTTAPGQQLGGPGTRAFLWQDGRLTDLGTLPGGDFSQATGINDAGQVIGFANRRPGTPIQAVLWQGGAPTELGTLPGAVGGRANAINNRGQVVGVAIRGPDQPLRAVLWAGGQVTDLGLPAGHAASRAFAINDTGLIAGRASDATEPVNPSICPAPLRCVPLLYRDGAWVQLATPPGSPNGLASGVNNAGQVVGLTQPPDGAGRALLWDGTAVTDLNTLIPAGSGWALTEALGITDRGQIVGNGLLNGQQRGYLLTPAAMPGLPNTGDGGAPARSPVSGALLAVSASLALLGVGAWWSVWRRRPAH